MGGGSVLAGMVLGAIAVQVIDNKMRHAAVWPRRRSPPYVGLIHGAQRRAARLPLVALGYVMFGVTRLVPREQVPAAAPEAEVGSAVRAGAALGCQRRAGRYWMPLRPVAAKQVEPRWSGQITT